MKTFKAILFISLFILIGCENPSYRTPLAEITNAVVVKMNKNNRNIEVIQYHYRADLKKMGYDFFTYKLCSYEFGKVQVGDSINYSKNIIVNQK